MKRLKYYALCLALPLAACVSTKPAVPVNSVKQVVFTYQNGTVAPNYRYNTELIVNGDLSTQWTYQNFKGKKQTKGTITPEQMARLKAKIVASNYMRVPVKELSPPLVGGSNKGLNITTNAGSRGFGDGCCSQFPKAIDDIYAMMRELTPHEVKK